MLVPCTFEGSEKNYLFDTGAQATAIQRTVLKGKKVTVRGATNRTMQNGTEILKTFAIGDVTFKNTFATNQDMVGLKEQIPNFGGILGRTIIDRANWLIDMPNNKATISDRDIALDAMNQIVLKDTEDGAPRTEFIIDGQSHGAILDLGSTARINVPETTTLASRIKENHSCRTNIRDRYTVGGLQNVEELICTVPRVTLGEVVFEDVEVTINESSQVRIGMNLFQDKIVYIDNINKAYWIK